MRIAAVSPHFPTRALPWRGVSHDEQLRLFAEAGHDVSAVVPLPWPGRWLAGRRIPDLERDGKIVVAHPRYPRVPRHLGGPGFALERWLFARAAATRLMAAVAPPDIVLAHSASLPGGLLGRIGTAALVVSLYDHELYQLAPVSAIVRGAIVRTLRRADCAAGAAAPRHRAGRPPSEPRDPAWDRDPYGTASSPATGFHRLHGRHSDPAQAGGSDDPCVRPARA